MYAINQLSRFNSCPREGHLKDLIHVYGFLHKWPNRRIVSGGLDSPTFLNEINTIKVKPPGNMKDYYRDSEWYDLPNIPSPKGKPVEVNIFVDASHADDKKDRKSVTGYVIFIGDMPYKYQSKRQKHVATSTYSAEFVALKIAVEEAISLKYTLQSIGVPLKGPIKIHCDNEAVLTSASTPGTELKRKSVAVAYHAVREAYALGVVEFYKVDTVDNIADVFTKPLNRLKFFRHTNRFLYKYQPDTKDLKQHDEVGASQPASANQQRRIKNRIKRLVKNHRFRSILED